MSEGYGMAAKIITLLTDFGLKDNFIGVMKGVIWSIAPDVQIADLTHAISAQNVLEGSLVLAQSVDYFPAGTVHVAVVDPGVGTARRGVAALIGTQYYVGPDNGLFTSVLLAAEARGETAEFFTLDKPEFWLPVVSRSFHGRDIFAPVAAHLAAGKKPQEMGSLITDPVRLNIPLPERTASGWLGQVLMVDHFGNLVTNIKPKHLEGSKRVLISIGDVVIDGLITTFGESQPGELVAMLDSSDTLQIAVVNGNAAEQLNMKVGSIVKLNYN
jgi:S-adenosyl-L-methionine hydrolase (adenosine-forming)